MKVIKNCRVEFSESGKVARLLTSNNRIIAEMLVHGPLLRAAENSEANAAIVNGRANIFRGELFALAGYEYLNVDQERIEER